ncbi:hypothetical protein Tco_1455419 [Tanacetum coccineum]
MSSYKLQNVISSIGDFLGRAPSYTSIRDLILRPCHRLITCSIVRRSQAPKKVFEVVRLGEEAGGYDIRGSICEEIDDIWAWVALRPERQPDAATGSHEAAKDALVVDEGALVVPTPVQAPQPPTVARTMAQRLGRLEEDIHQIRKALGKQREMMSQAGFMYTSYADFHIPYKRHTRHRTDDASTSTAQQDEQQPDP